MKILIVGSGGREHAIGWKISQSPLLKKLYCAPGNAGTEYIGENVPIGPEDIPGLVDFAAKQKIDLTVVGPEVPLTLGIVDEFEKKGLKIFGPNKNAAELEGSKVFAKQFMERHRIPTGKFEIADSVEQARTIVRSNAFSYPLVIKADGLAAGKGVIVCRNPKRAEEAINKILVEEFLVGKEASFIVISDGVKILPLVTTMDHKAVYDGDKGPNTGGMGAISPSPYIDQKMFDDIVNIIVFPTVTRMLEEGRKFRGVLYVGLMLTAEGPKVLEYNCRFGDPETQPQMLRMKGDLLEVLLAAVEGNVLEKEIEWSPKASACVVAASGGYPIKYEKGKVIEGLDEAASFPGIVIFHAGTTFKDGRYYTNGGRVLNVCASEESLAEAMDKIYRALSRIYFEAMHWRRDIGALGEEE
jgi:phosphoribosylamine--glycine ligase